MIMDLVLMIGMVYAITRSIRGMLGGAPRGMPSRSQGRQKTTPSAAQGRTARDPVCGMFVSTEVSYRLEENGRVLHFCSKKCLETYEKHNVRT